MRSFARLASGALLLVAAVSDAQVTKEDAGCRSAIQKGSSKLAATALRAIDTCHKSALKTGTPTQCNDVGVADSKGKVAHARTKLDARVTKSCATASLAALARYPSCPSPANADDDGGATAGVDDFAEVAACEGTLNTAGIETLRRYVLTPDVAATFAHPNGMTITACGNAIAKYTTKAWRDAAKLRGKTQVNSDKSGGSYDYIAFAASVSSIETSCASFIAEACAGLDGASLALLNSCAASPAGIGACACHATVKNAGGATATAFEFAGICPTQVTMTLNPGSRPSELGRLSPTNLEWGSTGLGHDMDSYDGVVMRVHLACSNQDCDSCAVTAGCEEGNCRCSTDSTISCSVPFVTGGPCGAGICQPQFGPPFSASAGGSPMCRTNPLNEDLAGTTDVGTGKSSIRMETLNRSYLGISQSHGCPLCSGAEIGLPGTCAGGQDNGDPCVTHAVHADFGPTSYDCRPAFASNISGGGVAQIMTLSDAHASLPFGDTCDPPIAAFDCACGFCSGDFLQECNGDGDCAALGLGTCEKSSGGGARRPNSCGDLTCEDAGGERGVCSGEFDSYCSGFLRKMGGGILTCSTDDDCLALSSECPGGNCGTCTLFQPKACFLDPVEVTGRAGRDGAELVAAHCAGSFVKTSINLAYGIPGAARTVTDWDFVHYCPDGVTEFELGGSNCP